MGYYSKSVTESPDKSGQIHKRHKHASSRLSRLGTYLFGACIWAEKAQNWHQQPSQQQRSRSRRKGADLGGTGGRETGQKTCNNGNGVCPVPDSTATTLNNGQSACTSGQKKTGVISFSQAGSAKSARKTVQSVDTCVADSFDEQMVDKMCALPKGLDRNEWLATHVLALFEHVNCISATLSEVCTPVTCSMMNYPGNMKAPWVDERGKRHNYSAMRYIDSVMSFCEASRKNQSLFPTKYGSNFCADFESHCARIVRLLWHCCGHMYSKHWEHLGTLNLRPQFGLVLAHLAKLAKQNSLLPDKELASLLSTLQLARPPPTIIGDQQQSQQQQRPYHDNKFRHGARTHSASATQKGATTTEGAGQQQQPPQGQPDGAGSATTATQPHPSTLRFAGCDEERLLGRSLVGGGCDPKLRCTVGELPEVLCANMLIGVHRSSSRTPRKTNK